METIIILNTTMILANTTVLVLSGNHMMKMMKEMSDNANRI